MENGNGPAPIIPATRKNIRYQWPEKDDEDERRLREGMTGGGDGLYIVWCPVRERKCLIEAYYPRDIRHEEYRKPVVVPIGPVGAPELVTMSDQLNPYQYADFQAGNLICIYETAVLEEGQGRTWLTPRHANPMPGGIGDPAALDNRLLAVLKKNYAKTLAAPRHEDIRDTKREFKQALQKEKIEPKLAEVDEWAGELARETAEAFADAVIPSVNVPEQIGEK